ncbi:helix-turn-helix domain-containing protein [Paenibacillus qinlingensis]|uniref:helix-turn-helix domain-containing protein n=1 Tax=Paenibacillus qinlingensis TaxID=1837343 RepID=UPI001563F34B|nr:helix-turn-helix domain-containing protein [Paenibacillus qinlingensis]NQX63070.1 AraC family transcriptional regulator [Paenibacillus qinlingensis]
MKLRASTFLSKLIWFTLLLATIPVMVLGAFSYYQASDAVQTKVNESNQQMLKQTESQIEQLLRLIDYSAIQYMNQPVVIDALKGELAGTDGYVQKVKSLLESMSKLQSNELGTMGMELISIANKWSINDTGLSMLETKAMESYAGWVNDPRTSFWSTSSTGMKLIKKIPAYSPNPSGLLIMSIPIYDVNSLINKDTAMGNVLLLDDQAVVFAGNSANLLGKQIQELQIGWNPSISTAEQGFYTSRSERERVGISYRKSNYNGWTYVSVVSIDELNKESQGIGWFTLYICLGILLLALLISYLGSRKMYKPIRKLYEVVRNSPETVGTDAAIDEFEFINERFRGLMQRESSLLQEVLGQSHQMREYFVFKLFQSDMARTEAQDKLEAFGHPTEWNSMCVMTIQIDTLSSTRFEEQDQDLLLFAINNIVSELITPEQRLPPVVMGDSQVTLLGGAETDPKLFKNLLDTAAHQIMQMIKLYLELKVSIGFSHMFNDIKQIRHAYGESLQALKYRMNLGEESILFIEDVQPEKSMQLSYPDAAERQLLDALKHADREQATRCLHQFISALAVDERTHEEYFMSFVRLLVQMLQAVKDAGVSPKRLYPDEQTLFIQLFQLKTVSEVERWFLDVVMLPFLIHLEHKLDEQYQSISSQIIHMIETGFDTDLSLEVCARRMNYSPNYLTKVFRKETGVNFSDYLSEYRMNMAKQWLLETDMKISEIAEKLKYNTPANFIRYFRKLEGTTPGQYRDSFFKK